MFNFILTKNLEVFAPCTGRIIDITQVQDPVFADKTMGDGFAVEPDSDTIMAPFDGTITFLPRTTHALILENNDVQLLIPGVAHEGLIFIDRAVAEVLPALHQMLAEGGPIGLLGHILADAHNFLDVLRLCLPVNVVLRVEELRARILRSFRHYFLPSSLWMRLISRDSTKA